MVSQRDPARFVLPIGASAAQLVIGVLFVLRQGEPFLTVVGGLLIVINVVGLVLSVRGYRREKARTDWLLGAEHGYERDEACAVRRNTLAAPARAVPRRRTCARTTASIE